MPDSCGNARQLAKGDGDEEDLQIGGIASGVVLIAFGIAVIVLAITGGNTVNDNLKQQFITGTPDMTPSAIQPEVKAIQGEQQKIAATQKQAKVPPSQQYTFTKVEAPGCSVAGQSVDDGNSAKCFAQYMNIHALGASSGLTYSQMGRYAAKPDAPVQFTRLQRRHERNQVRTDQPNDGPACVERRTRSVGDRDGVDDGALSGLRR